MASRADVVGSSGNTDMATACYGLDFANGTGGSNTSRSASFLIAAVRWRRDDVVGSALAHQHRGALDHVLLERDRVVIPGPGGLSAAI